MCEQWVAHPAGWLHSTDGRASQQRMPLRSMESEYTTMYVLRMRHPSGRSSNWMGGKHLSCSLTENPARAKGGKEAFTSACQLVCWVKQKSRVEKECEERSK
ncbi:hypothetical protein CSUI_011066 [Cystoisospora suis]|uniref:Uncharacterized protein n=1 Tax=Cystoisospora suis TaxID=483139 RepID=A0A2C6KEY1_9APIC|nr:hypothetical protein CSUI_011066 [Cystoisospora suis]